METERILVVPTDALYKRYGIFEGFLRVDLRDFLDFLEENGFFVDRPDAEYDEGKKQVIPYLVFLEDGKILLVKRTKKQTERRLHDLYSVGLGGHVRMEDGQTPVEAFLRGLERELKEEVVAKVNQIDFLGLINSFQDEVSRVHLGALFVVKGAFERMNEEELFEWWLVELEDLKKYENTMESWSRIVVGVLPSFLSRR